MKLILEKSNGSFFAYFETEKHFKNMEKIRSKQYLKLDPKLLEEECSMPATFCEGSYMVIKVQK